MDLTKLDPSRKSKEQREKEEAELLAKVDWLLEQPPEEFIVTGKVTVVAPPSKKQIVKPKKEKVCKTKTKPKEQPKKESKKAQPKKEESLKTTPKKSQPQKPRK